MKFSYSRVDCYKQCQYKFKLRYIDKLSTLDEYDPQDALRLGTAVHVGIQESTDKAVKDYLMSYPVVNDLHINESIKIETMCKKAINLLPLDMSEFEVPLENEIYKGFIDMLTIHEDGKTFDIYDFKYSNNIDKYMESGQLSVYKYFAEQILGIKIDKLYFVFVQKVGIRQKKTETLHQFRQRLKNTLKDAEVTIKEVDYDENKVYDFLVTAKEISNAKEFTKNKTKLCDWCEFQSYCEKGEDLYMLPSTKRVEVEQSSKKKIWIYGLPFTGKTTFADQAPTPLNLNTDGNVKYVTMPRMAIKDEVTTEGRITKRKFAWDVFKEAVEELEKGSEFETIVVDLLEDVYDHCRIKVCEDNGWDHESDDSFKAYDIVRSEFLRTMKRLLNLDYNVILISHEDTTKDIMKKGGDKVTSIQPNIPEKVAKKLTGMVDLVARLVVDGDKRTLNFKSDEVVFGGGRLQGVKTTEIPLSWDALCGVYDEAIGNIATDRMAEPVGVKITHKPESAEVEQEEPTPESEPEQEEKPARRTRRKRD